ncbi:unnamed protein product, partial [marine sediment metagenome]
ELVELMEEDYGQCEILPLSNLLSRSLSLWIYL